MCIVGQPCHPCVANSGYCCASVGYNICIATLHSECPCCGCSCESRWQQRLGIPIPTIQIEFVEFSSQEIDEEQVKPGDKDSDVKEMQQKLKKSQHIIAQLY
jgi:hypothetical protein